jgi:hypothetical protein
MKVLLGLVTGVAIHKDGDEAILYGNMCRMYLDTPQQSDVV